MLLRFAPRALAGLVVCLTVLLAAGCATTTGKPPAQGTASAHRTAPAAPTASTPSGARGLATVQESRLPAEARRTLALIDKGGPFPYSQDGVVFGNHEKRLPQQSRGYYHEYTVKTPGAHDRGARRIVTGRDGEIYYTDDHYDTFRAVTR
ncbi:ribonuclease domain-containing protein [Streptomyces sp. NPDC047017]|uniref:ribonuclease domain-containing protein n=1 Tax=Streptomyces sp. NPDC047017 TaxID=3155024 RepID=UPI0033F27112